MYDKAFKGAPNYPLANAISTIMVAISFILIAITKVVENALGERSKPCQTYEERISDL